MNSLLAYDRDADVDTEQVPFAFAGIAGKQVNRNPFRRISRRTYVLEKGALFIISERPKEEVSQWIKEFVKQLSEQYASIPYNDRTRKIYAKNYRRNDNVDTGMIIHYWVHKFKGLEYTLIDLQSVDLRVGFIYGKGASVDILELLGYAIDSIPRKHPMKKRLLRFFMSEFDKDNG